MCKNYFLDFIHRRPARCHFIMVFLVIFYVNLYTFKVRFYSKFLTYHGQIH